MGLENWKFILAGSALHLSCHQMAVAQTPKIDPSNFADNRSVHIDRET